MDVKTDAYLSSLVTTKAELAQLNIAITAAHLRFLLKRISAEGVGIADKMIGNPPERPEYFGLTDDDTKRLESIDASIRHLFLIDSAYLRSHPDTARHYRCLLGLSKKAARKSFKILFAIETNGKASRSLSDDALREEISRANRALIEAYESVGYDVQLAKLVIASTAGATLDGIWRNEIGNLAEFDVADAICYYGDGNVSKLVAAEGASSAIERGYAESKDLVATLRDNFTKIEAIEFSNGARITFPSNPDMRVFNATGSEVAVGELKGNTDPANVWERWPLAEKTLGEAKKNTPAMLTIFIGEVITQNLAFGEFMGSRQAVNSTGEAATRNGIKQRIADGTVDYAFKKSSLKQSEEFRETLATLLGITTLATPEPKPAAASELIRDEDLDGGDVSSPPPAEK